MPNYSRSHLGRYVRKHFASEIERELRMLEEYVVSNEVSDDVGENLISNVLGPDAEFSRFSPKQEVTHVEDDHIETNVETGVDSRHRTGAPTRVEGAASDEDDEDDDEETGNMALHGANTLILDEDKHQRPSGSRRRSLPDEIDEALHSAPTLILDHRRGRNK